MANDGYNLKPSMSYGSNANVKTSKLNTGGDKKWKGKRGSHKSVKKGNSSRKSY